MLMLLLSIFLAYVYLGFNNASSALKIPFPYKQSWALQPNIITFSVFGVLLWPLSDYVVDIPQCMREMEQKSNIRALFYLVTNLTIKMVCVSFFVYVGLHLAETVANGVFTQIISSIVIFLILAHMFGWIISMLLVVNMLIISTILNIFGVAK